MDKEKFDSQVKILREEFPTYGPNFERVLNYLCEMYDITPLDLAEKDESFFYTKYPELYESAEPDSDQLSESLDNYYASTIRESEEYVNPITKFFYEDPDKDAANKPFNIMARAFSAYGDNARTTYIYWVGGYQGGQAILESQLLSAGPMKIHLDNTTSHVPFLAIPAGFRLSKVTNLGAYTAEGEDELMTLYPFEDEPEDEDGYEIEDENKKGRYVVYKVRRGDEPAAPGPYDLNVEVKFGA